MKVRVYTKGEDDPAKVISELRQLVAGIVHLDPEIVVERINVSETPSAVAEIGGSVTPVTVIDGKVFVGIPDPDVVIDRLQAAAPKDSFEGLFGASFLHRPGQAYRALDTFLQLHRSGAHGMVISPNRELSALHSPGVGRSSAPLVVIEVAVAPPVTGIRPNDPEALIDTVEDFLARDDRSVVLIDPLDPFIEANGFDLVLNSLRILKDLASSSSGCLLVTLGQQPLDAEQRQRLEQLLIAI